MPPPVLSTGPLAIAPPIGPTILSIGMFDGVHLGHQFFLEQQRALAKKEGLSSTVFTFSNHPTTILNPNHPKLLLTTAEKKESLLKRFVDQVVMVPFTSELSQQSAVAFLQQLKDQIPFRYLLLGHDNHIGHDKQNDTPLLRRTVHALHALLETVPTYQTNGYIPSSSHLRHLIAQGDLLNAQQLLGRPYSLCGTPIKGMGLAKQLGYPTLNIPVEGLCLPPFGVYAVYAHINNQKIPGIANIGFAPTVRHDHRPLVEAYLFSFPRDSLGSYVEIEIVTFLRPERTFNSLEALSTQIHLDVQEAQEFFGLCTNP